LPGGAAADDEDDDDDELALLEDEHDVTGATYWYSVSVIFVPSG